MSVAALEILPVTRLKKPKAMGHYFHAYEGDDDESLTRHL
jgi:hypothetical protein